MKKPNPLAIIALCVVAISILAFTINDALNNRRKNTAEGSLAVSKNPISTSPFVTYNPPHGKPGHRHDLPDGAPLPGIAPNQSSPAANNLPFSDTRTTEAAAAPAGIALNPAHGQPGHRCEIAVGAPLNSPAPVNKETTLASSNVSTVPVSGKNPEHGKPGHRCDIAVGAPLNSAPAKTVSSTTASAPAANTAQVAQVAPGLNPAHGQPGHRCDIAVGAPLNQAATTTTSTNKPASSLFPNYSFSTKDSAASVSPIITADGPANP